MANRRKTIRVMLDTNAFDRLDADPEAADELENRRDLRLFITDVQAGELAAIPDPERRERYVALAARLCVTVRAGGTGSSGAADRHEHDRLIAEAASARCDLLVTDDAGLQEYAAAEGLRAAGWERFLAGMVLGRR